MFQDLNAQSRLLAKVMRDLLAAESFETLADLAAALKGRCARLRIRPTPDAISDALRLVGSNHRLVAPPWTARVATAVSPAPEPISRREAALIYAELLRRYGSRVTVKTPRTA